MPPKQDLKGCVFGNLRVISSMTEREPSSGAVIWRCICKCGNECFVPARALVHKNTKSCGCRRGEIHGEYKNPLYKCWERIIQRSTQPKHHPTYAGRGITVCDEWRNSFVAFRDWALANGWKEGLQINRKNNDGSYTPENCEFVTHKENQRNTTRTIWVTIEGERKSLAEWCEQFKIPYHTVYCRVKQMGWCVERALTEPVDTKMRNSNAKTRENKQ